MFLLSDLVLIKVVVSFGSVLLHILGKSAEEACLHLAFIIYLHDSVLSGCSELVLQHVCSIYFFSLSQQH